MLRSTTAKQLLLNRTIAMHRVPLVQWPCRHFPRKKGRDREELTLEDVDKRGGRQIHKDQLMARLSPYKVKPLDHEGLAFQAVRSKKEMEALGLDISGIEREILNISKNYNNNNNNNNNYNDVQ